MSATELKAGSGQTQKRSFAFRFFILIFLCWFCGCSMIPTQCRMRSKTLLYDKELSAVYDQTKVKKSLTLDVLPRIEGLKDELLSQSESVVASLGQSKSGYKTWFTMVAFHEYELSVIRKYFFVVDERIEIRSKQGLRFDCEVLPAKEELDNIHAAKGVKQIALLRGILDNLRKDAAELGGGTDTAGRDNQTLDISVMLIKQVFETILLKLDSFPVLAPKLSDPDGVEFNHLNFGRGKIQVTARDNIVVVKIRLGALLCTFENLEESGSVQEPAKLQ